MADCFEIIAEDRGTNARTGKLKTGHSLVNTPMFMPVATKMAAKYIGNEELVEIGVEAIIVNGFILSLSPGVDVIKKAGSRDNKDRDNKDKKSKGSEDKKDIIHRFMNFNKTIFTDSGGFQLIRSSFSPKVNYNGIYFTSPFSGKTGLLKPEDSVRIQNELGSDVAMCLDDMPPYVKGIKGREEIEKAVKITHDWAKRCKAEFEQNRKNNELAKLANKEQLLFGITQGGVFRDLREESARFIDSLDFDGIAIGGFGEGETAEEMFEMIEHSVKFIDKEKPRYLMGIGSPILLLEAISHGIDCFDSVFPTQNGRRNTVFTWDGKIRITNKQYEADMEPLDSECGCFVCKSFTKAYLHHLADKEEPNAKRYLSYHNVYFVQKLLEKAREEIKAGSFLGFLEKIKNKYEKTNSL